MIKFLPVIAVCLIGACATETGPMPPANYVFDKSRSATKDAITAQTLARGFQLRSDSDQKLTFTKDAQGMAAVLFSSNYDSSPDAQISYTFTGDRPTTVYTNLAILTNPGSGFEKATQLDNNREGRQIVSEILTQAGGKPLP